MAKFSKVPKLNKKQRQELMLALCDAIVKMKKPEEAAKLISDLLSPQELEMIAKRLEIAKLLMDGHTYEYIRGVLKTGASTVARVNTWLNISGEGFKLAYIRRQKTKPVDYDEVFDPQSWYNFKRRYSMYFGIELFLEEFIKQSNKHEKEKIFTILQSMEDKPAILKKVTEAVNQQFAKYKINKQSFSANKHKVKRPN